jgi:hypothetical protein
MPTTQTTPAGEALRAMLPEGSDPYATIALATHAAFLARDQDLLPGVCALVKSDPELTAGLIVTLTALVDIDASPAGMLGWLGTHGAHREQSARQIGALIEARAEYDAAAADTLPPVTLESMRALGHAARLARVMYPCGTYGAYTQHVSKGQEPCTRCALANWLYEHATEEERRLLKTPLPRGPGRLPETATPSLARCGTAAGYDAHLKRRSRPCQKCLLAAAAAIKPPNCGTITGFDAHLERGQRPCGKCQDTAEQIVERAGAVRRSCGSHTGYVSHKSRKEEVCTPCRTAQREYDAARYDERLKRAGRARVGRGGRTGLGTIHQMPDRTADRRHTVAA